MTADVTSLDSLAGEPHAHVFPGSEPRTVRLSLAEGEAIPAHQHPGRVVVCHVLDGVLALSLGDGGEYVSAGEVARFDGAQDISPEAVEATEALLVLAKRAD